MNRLLGQNIEALLEDERVVGRIVGVRILEQYPPYADDVVWFVVQTDDGERYDVMSDAVVSIDDLDTVVGR